MSIAPRPRRPFLGLVFAAVAIGLGGTANAEEAKSQDAAAQKRPPNVVFMLVDDLGWRDTGCYGQTQWATPRIDELAASGCRFTQAYAMPLCSPTRSMLMYGKHCVRLGVTDWMPGYGPPKGSTITTPKMAVRLSEGDLSLGGAFAKAGYRACHIGKWHMPRGPLQSGFHEARLLEVFHNKTEQNKADEAVKFFAEHRDTPFFLYLCFSSVHLPLDALPETVAKHASTPNPTYAAMVDQLDGYVGTVMDGLRDLGLINNTIVVLSSDNGGVQRCDASPKPVTNNLPLRGNKGSLYEGGVRVPLIVSYPPVVAPGSTTDAIVGPADFFPTLLEVCGLPSRPEQHVDGLSFATALHGKPGPRRTMHWHYPHFSRHAMGFPAGGMRRDEWKLIEWYGQRSETGGNRVELFHLGDDPGEQNDLADRFPEVRDSMLADLARWRQDTGALMPEPVGDR